MANEIGRVDIDVRASMARYRRDMENFERLTKRSADNAQRTVDRTNNRIGRLGTGLNANMQTAVRSMGRVNVEIDQTDRLVRNVIGTLGGVALARAVVGMADQYTNLSARIRLVVQEGENFADVQERIFQVAQRTRAPVAELTNLYTRLRQSIAGLGDAEALNISEVLAQTLSISGAGPSETAAFLRQISQALASGVLRGDEFNSVMENNSRFARLLADQLGVGVGELRKMAEEGRLTADVIRGGIAGGAADVNAEFERMPLTLGGAFTQILNAMQRYVGETDQGLGASRRLAQGVSILARNFDTLADSVILLGAALAGRYAGVAVNSAIGVAKRHLEAAQEIANANRSVARARQQSVREVISTAAAQRTALTAEMQALDTQIARAKDTISRIAAERAARMSGSDQGAINNSLRTGRPPVLEPERDAWRVPIPGAPQRAAPIGERDQLADAERQLTEATRRRVQVEGELARSSAQAAAESVRLGRASLDVAKHTTVAASAMRAVSTAGVALRTGLSSLVGFLGGPWGVALTAATIALILFKNEEDKAAARTANLEQALATIANMRPAFEGAATAIGESADQTERVADLSSDAAEQTDRLAEAHRNAAGAARDQTEAERALAEIQRRARIEQLQGVLVEQRAEQRRLVNRIDNRAAARLSGGSGFSGLSPEESRAYLERSQAADVVALNDVNAYIELVASALAGAQSGLAVFGDGSGGGGGGGGVSFGGGGATSIAELRASAELTLARLRNENERVAALEDALEIERRTDAYIKAGLSAAGARLEAEREVRAERDAIIDQQRENLEITALQHRMDIERARGNVLNAEAIEDELETRRIMLDLMREGMIEEEAAKVAAERVAEQIAAREIARAREVAMRRLEFAREVAEAEGDDHRVRQIERQLETLRRVEDLHDVGASESEANKQAAHEVEELTRAEWRGQAREAFSSALLAAVTNGDWKDALAESFRNAAERGWSRAIDYIYDGLEWAVRSAFQGAGGGGGGGSLLGSILGGIGRVLGGGQRAPVAKANGGPIKPFTAYKGAELGTEPVFLTNRPGNVVTSSQMRAALTGAGGGGRTQIFNIDARGADGANIEAKIRIAAAEGAAAGEQGAIFSIARRQRAGSSF